MRRRLAVSMSALALGLIGGLGASAQAASPPVSTVDAGLYVVVLSGAPLASSPATAPTLGHRFRADSAAAQRYRQILLTEQRRILAALGDPTVLYSYTTALNGFAAELDTTQVKQLQSMPGVLAVQADETVHLDRFNGPSDVTTARGGGLSRTLRGMTARAGHGVVIGVIDTGIWPENPSFAGLPITRAELRHDYPGFSGRCQAGERWNPTSCNAKVVAARYFVEGFGVDNISSAEFVSPRDGSGHGSHTAATAAGNAGVAVTIGKQDFGHVSGTAPGAAISVYKACWAAPDPADDGCSTVDTIKAVDQAVSDGVDVINYSLGGAQGSSSDVVELAFLNAATAGVFVATSAGDGGPAASSVAHPSPWVTTVGASTHQLFQGSVELGDGTSVVGSMVSDETIASSPLVYAGNVPASGSDAHEAALCYPGSLDAAQVEDAIVVCDRGEVARVMKSATVAESGGIAMVLANDAPGSTDTDIHAVPTVQVTQAEGAQILAYVARAASPTARLDATATEDTPVPLVADFSARGPAEAAAGDVLKPDVTAPGVSIVSAVAPASNFGRLWDLYSGTSMAAPQVAGLAAVIQAAHPRWSPAIVKSALMTSAAELEDNAGPLTRGAGEIAPTEALDPGLAYDADRSDWLSFLRGQSLRGQSLRGQSLSAQGLTRTDGTPVAAGSLDASDLNQASISIGSLVGEQKVTRRVINVSASTETYVASVQGLHGIAVSVSPPSFQVAPGQSRTYSVSFSAKKAAGYDRYAQGALVWTGSEGHIVTSPVTIHPDVVRAPADVTASSTDGSTAILADAGVTGTIATSVVGPVGAVPVSVELTPGDFSSERPDEATGTAVQTFAVPADTAALRFEVDSADAGADVDLYVYRGSRLVAAATSPSRHELVTLANPAAGDYGVVLTAPSSDSTGAVSADFTGWVLPEVGGAGLSVNPGPVDVTGGLSFALDVSWADLSDSRRWLAAVRYEGSHTVTYVTLN